jgi:hypothetical protein
MDTGWFATREDVRSSLSSASQARDDAQVDRALAAATASVVELCHRDFTPVLATRVFDWPSEQTARSWRLWLDRNELITATLITSGGVTIPATDYYLEPANYGPPYDCVEIRLDRPSNWQAGNTHQHAATILGLYGHSDTAQPAGTLVGAINTATTAVTVSDSTAVGVGDLLRCGTERMVVTDKGLVNSGQTLQAPLGQQKNEALATVADGAGYRKGETLTLGAERVRVRDIAGNTLMVERAYDGTQLDSHSGGETIWAPRLLTVARGAAGTTASSAVDGALLTRWIAPGPVRTLAIAEAMNTLLMEQSGYARTVRSQAGTGTRSVAAVTAEIDSLRSRVFNAYGRKARIRVV